MKKISANLLFAGMASFLFALAGSTSPALSKCIQKHPIFGVDVYVEDKYCEKKPVKIKAVKKKSPSVENRPVAAPVMAAKPDNRIKKMQSLLAGMGYDPGPVDGYNGPQTRNAAGEFNISNDLPEKASTGSTIAVLEGLMGNNSAPETVMQVAVAPQKAVVATAPATFEAVAPALASAPAPVSDDRVRKMQTLLARMGYNPGPADGVNTPATRKAAGEFNVANDLPKKASTGSTIAVLSALMGN